MDIIKEEIIGSTNIKLADKDARHAYFEVIGVSNIKGKENGTVAIYRKP